MKHFLTLKDFSKEEILEIIELAFKIKKELKSGIYNKYMENKTLGMIFEKSSTRTRVSFETGIGQLGGNGLFLSTNDIQLGKGEPIKDTSRVIGRMVDMVMIRTFGQERIEEYANYSKVPVINALTDEYHPMQLLASYMMIIEKGLDKNLIVAYVGDGNNLAHSWLMLASKIGFELRISTPKGYEVDSEILKIALEQSKLSGSKIVISEGNIKNTVLGATVVTTDTWTSMGKENEKKQRIKDFQGYMIDENIMKLADKKAIFTHCLPAYRGYEVSDETLEKFSDEVFLEAENRLHVQKGVMVWLDQKNKN